MVHVALPRAARDDAQRVRIPRHLGHLEQKALGRSVVPARLVDVEFVNDPAASEQQNPVLRAAS